MDQIARYKKIIREILESLAGRVPVNMPEVKKHLVVDEKGNEFVLVSLGRRDGGHYYNVLAHIEIRDTKILIHEESIDPSLYERLTDRGIPEADIFPVYLPDYEWEIEGSALA